MSINVCLSAFSNWLCCSFFLICRSRLSLCGVKIDNLLCWLPSIICRRRLSLCAVKTNNLSCAGVVGNVDESAEMSGADNGAVVVVAEGVSVLLADAADIGDEAEGVETSGVGTMTGALPFVSG